MTTVSPWTEERLASLDQHGRFQLRGGKVTRLETFVDAAFAFAVTMLVISVDDVPQNYNEFIDALLSAPAFIASFFQVIMFWLGHRAWSQRYGLEDGTALFLSLVLVCCILIVVYPLRVMFAAAFGYFSGGWLPFPFTLGWEEMRAVFAIYGFGFFVMCMFISALYMHAYRRRDWLNLNAAEVIETRNEIEAWLIPALTGLTGMGIALVAQGEWLLLAGWVYITMCVSLPLHDRFAARRHSKTSA
ncbi:DUF1211 domain-containing protein [Pseudohongiella sp. O18]|uniref:DUF1211 domain-containing protein n=1 Tax=Pseudohongiella sp. O18 TaxID=2904248 RepID=UPI001F2EE4DD|nr:DUF1211 domain-containing protein [Pseudohongiella sp. O18]